MQKHNNTVNTYNEKFISIVALAVALVMVVSFIVALTKFADNEQSVSSEEDVTSIIESSAPVVESSSEETEVSQATYEYYDKISYSDKEVNNSDVVNGNLAIIKNDSTSFPIIDNSKVSGIPDVMTKDVYGLSGYALKMYKESIQNIDSFIVGFYNEVPSNGLIIDKAYLAPTEADAEKGTIELSTGHSVRFAIYRSSYKFSDTEFRFLSEQAYRYGVIQRYPAGKKKFTGYDEDSTIYRYVGHAHSYYMNYYKYCLEEYIDYLRTHKIVEFKSGIENNTAYVVYYVPLDKTSNTTKVPIPTEEGYTYTVSGDGSQGFIVTVKLPVG